VVDGLVVGREGAGAVDVDPATGVVLVRPRVVAGVVRVGGRVFARDGAVTVGRRDGRGAVVTGACSAPVAGATVV
jgi:hypothetical protein